MSGLLHLVVLLGLGGGALAVGRPQPSRWPAASSGAAVRRAALVGSVGRQVRHRLGRRADPVADRRLGRALLVGGVVTLLDPVVAVGAGAGVWLVPWWRERQAIARAERAIGVAVPDLVDLVRLGVTAGLPVRGALAAAAEHLDAPLAVRVTAVLDDAGRGRPLADALAGAALGTTAQPLVDALVAGERYGAPLSGVLERVADEARRAERLRAERAARRLPVALLFPLVLCTLPAFALVTVVPVLVSTLSALDG